MRILRFRKLLALALAVLMAALLVPVSAFATPAAAPAVQPPRTYVLNFIVEKFDVPLVGSYTLECSIDPAKIFSIPSYTPELDGHTFMGWKCSADNSIYHPGGSFLYNGSSASVTMTAVFEPMKFTVMFVSNASDVIGSAPAAIEMAYGSSFVVEKPDMVRRNYDFFGWIDGEAVLLLNTSVTITGPKLLKALWMDSAVKQYQLTFLPGISGSTEMVPKLYNEKTEVKVSDVECTFKNPGFIFAGWQLRGGAVVTDSSPAVVMTEDLVYIATWTEDPNASSATSSDVSASSAASVNSAVSSAPSAPSEVTEPSTASSVPESSMTSSVTSPAASSEASPATSSKTSSAASSKTSSAASSKTSSATSSKTSSATSSSVSSAVSSMPIVPVSEITDTHTGITVKGDFTSDDKLTVNVITTHENPRISEMLKDTSAIVGYDVALSGGAKGSSVVFNFNPIELTQDTAIVKIHFPSVLSQSGIVFTEKGIDDFVTAGDAPVELSQYFRIENGIIKAVYTDNPYTEFAMVYIDGTVAEVSVTKYTKGSLLTSTEMRVDSLSPFVICATSYEQAPKAASDGGIYLYIGIAIAAVAVAVISVYMLKKKPNRKSGDDGEESVLD